MQALFDLARGSSLQREKSELNIIQGTMESLPENKPEQSSGASPEHGQQSHSSDNASESISVDDQRTGRSMDRLRSVLTNMVKKLEVQIDTTEKVVGDKFNVLDKDGDGHLTAHELREAIVQLMRRDFSLQEADRLVDLLDDDKDGKGERSPPQSCETVVIVCLNSIVGGADAFYRTAEGELGDRVNAGAFTRCAVS